MSQSNDLIYNIIDKRIEQQFKAWARQNKILCKKLVQVASYDGVAGTATLYFPPDYTNASVAYKNKTGGSLSAGDWIYLLCEVTNVSQGWIYDKK
jgi:hypothetical protein